jgi:hypothetical protein
VSRVSTASAEKNLLGFRARASRISSKLAVWLQAGERGGPRYCGGLQSGLKKRLSSPDLITSMANLEVFDLPPRCHYQVPPGPLVHPRGGFYQLSNRLPASLSLSLSLSCSVLRGGGWVGAKHGFPASCGGCFSRLGRVVTGGSVFLRCSATTGSSWRSFRRCICGFSFSFPFPLPLCFFGFYLAGCSLLPFISPRSRSYIMATRRRGWSSRSSSLLCCCCSLISR